MCNQEIRNEIAGNGLKLWQVAEKLGLADCQFSRKLRNVLPEEYKHKILEIIADLKQESEHNG